MFKKFFKQTITLDMVWSPFNLKRFDYFQFFNDDASTKFKQALDISVKNLLFSVLFQKSVKKI